MAQHVTVLTKTTGHGGQLPDTVGNDFRKRRNSANQGVNDAARGRVSGVSHRRASMADRRTPYALLADTAAPPPRGGSVLHL